MANGVLLLSQNSFFRNASGTLAAYKQPRRLRHIMQARTPATHNASGTLAAHKQPRRLRHTMQAGTPAVHCLLSCVDGDVTAGEFGKEVVDGYGSFGAQDAGRLNFAASKHLTYDRKWDTGVE